MKTLVKILETIIIIPLCIIGGALFGVMCIVYFMIGLPMLVVYDIWEDKFFNKLEVTIDEPSRVESK